MRSITRFLTSNNNARMQLELMKQKNKVMDKAVGEDARRTGVAR
jgi:hypothetical protein